MADRLLLRYTNEGLSWALCSSGDVTDHGIAATPQDLPVGEFQTIFLAPTADILLARAELPKTSHSKLLQAIPFALEEDLSADIDAMHFATGNWHAGKLNIAVVDKSLLQQWLDTLQTNGKSIDSITADVLALPLQANTWTVVIEHDISLIRTEDQHGTAIDTSNLPIMLRALINEAVENKPDKLIIYNYRDINIDELRKFVIEIEENKQPPAFLSLAAATLTEAQPLNLCQAEFKPKHKASKTEKTWRLAAILGSAWLAALIIGSSAEYFYFKHQDSSQHAEVIKLYQQVFPGKTDVSSAKLDVEKEIRALMQAASGSPFLRLLAKTGNVIKNNKDINMQSLSYASNKILLKVDATSFESLADIETKLKAQGLTVEQSNVTSEGKRVTAQLTIQ